MPITETLKIGEYVYYQTLDGTFVDTTLGIVVEIKKKWVTVDWSDRISITYAYPSCALLKV